MHRIGRWPAWAGITVVFTTADPRPGVAAPARGEVGGTVRYVSPNPVNVIGDGENSWWDAILVVANLRAYLGRR